MKQKLHYHLPKCLMLLIICLLSVNSWGQGSENFSNLPTGSASSYNGRTWTGTDGVEWTATAARTDQTLTGKAICTNGTTRITSPVYAGGMGLLQFNYVRGFSSASARSIDVYVNGNKIGNTITVNANSSTVAAYSTAINVTGNVTLELRTSGAQIVIDDITWAAFSASTPSLSTNIAVVPDFGNVAVGANSTNNSFTVSGVNLSGDITVNAPSANFQLSKDQSAWSGSVTLTPSANTLTSVPVYVRFAPQSAGAKSGNITFTGGGVATMPTVAVSGTGILQTPVTIAGTNVDQTQFNANWNAVSGATGYRLDVATNAAFGVVLVSENFSEFTTDTGTTDRATELDDYMSLPGWTGDRVYEMAGYTKLGTGNARGGMTTPVLNLSGNGGSAVLKFDIQRYGSDSSIVQVFHAADGTNFVQVGSDITGTSSFVTQTVQITGGTVNSKIRIQAKNASNNRFYMDNVSVDFSTILPAYKDLAVTGTTQLVTGLTPNTAYYYRVRAIDGLGVTANSNVTTVTTKLSTVTWNGTAWSNVTGPDATIEAVIAGAYNTNTNGVFTTKKLTLNSGSFTLASGTNLTVVNEVVNNMTAADFVIQNNANLIQTNAVANTGAVTLHRNSAPIVRLDHTLWSSPVEAQNLFGFSPNTLTNRFYTYQTSTNTYVNTGLTAATTFVVGKGFAVRAPNNYQASPAAAWEGTFVGKPNNGNVTFTLETTGTGYNMVGNPYPSVIDGATFVSNNTTIDGTLYFYAHTLTMNAQGQFPAGTNYATWTPGVGGVAATAGTSGVPANVPNGKIQVGQGFIVKSLPAGGNVTFANTMRAAENGNQFFKVSSANATLPETEKHRMWLNLTNDAGTAFNQILVAYAEGATEGVDRGYDGLAFGTTGSALSSKIAGADYTIQGRSLPFNAEDVVTLGFKAATAGNYSVTLSAMDGLFLGTQDVYLKDKTAGVLHDLKAGAYAFASAEGTFDNRFEIVYKNTLGTVDATLDANAVVVFRQNAALHIETKNTQIKDIAIFDIRGRLVYQKANVNAGSFVISDLTAANEVLLVQVKSEDNKTKTVKVIY